MKLQLNKRKSGWHNPKVVAGGFSTLCLLIRKNAILQALIYSVWKSGTVPYSGAFFVLTFKL